MQLRPYTRHLFTSLIALAATCAVHAQAGQSLADAHRAHYLGEHRLALSLYEQLAAAGNAEAAERAGFMLLLGSADCGVRLMIDRDRATALLLQAAHAGRPSAVVMLNLLEATD
jgi:TPR repeat protein